MGNLAIQVENLGKRYFIGGKEDTYRTFRDTIAKSVSSPVRRMTDVVRGRANSAAGYKETIWALKDISFEVERGEAVGIIGANGSGKSTLLKILSRITEPTEGQVKMNGRISALLEVGTGFHLELTGRENVYLNAAILGMKRKDIDRKFDEIVDFAGVEKFIDTPVKYYSSGMGLRLGFAVAAYLEPDILVVDEVLAVGDAEFQKKCLGKMQDVAQQGRTVLFVSHNMDAITTLTQRCVLLNQGHIIDVGDSETIVKDYLRSLDSQGQADGWMDLTPFADLDSRDFEFTWMSTIGENGERRTVFSEREPILVRLGVRILQPGKIIQFGVSINDLTTARSLFTVPGELDTSELFVGDYEVRLLISPNFLRTGDFGTRVKINAAKRYGINALNFKIIANPYASPLDPLFAQKWVAGPLRFDYQFGNLEQLEQEIPSSEHE